LLSDVLHHVPDELRLPILTAIEECLALGGVFLFKDWERRTTPIHWLGYAADRWLTGDRIHFLRMHEARALIERALPHGVIAASERIRPWRNNYAMLITT